MGNSESVDTSGKISYERLGSVTIKSVQEEGEQIEIMSFSRSVESQKIYSDWCQEIQRTHDTEIEEVLLLPKNHSFEKAGMCSSSGLVHVLNR